MKVTIALENVGVIVAFPERVTAVEAFVEPAKDAFAGGEAVQPENTYPVLGVAVICVAVPELTVRTDAGVIDPLDSAPGVRL